MLGYPPTLPGTPVANRPTCLPLGFGSTKGSPPSPPPLSDGIPRSKRAAITLITRDVTRDLRRWPGWIETGVTKGDAVHGVSMTDDPHTILMILQLHISFVRIANRRHGDSKLSQPGVEYLVDGEIGFDIDRDIARD